MLAGTLPLSAAADFATEGEVIAEPEVIVEDKKEAGSKIVTPAILAVRSSAELLVLSQSETGVVIDEDEGTVASIVSTTDENANLEDIGLAQFSNDDLIDAQQAAASLNATCDPFCNGPWGDVIVPPTCTEWGSYQNICQTCNTLVNEPWPVGEPKGHTSYTKVIPPTCASRGYSVNACTGCDIEEFIPFTFVDALGHSFVPSARGEIFQRANGTMNVEYICDRDICNGFVVYLVVDTLFAAIAEANLFLNEDFSGYTDKSVEAAKNWVFDKLKELENIKVLLLDSYHRDAAFAALLGGVDITGAIAYARTLLVSVWTVTFNTNGGTPGSWSIDVPSGSLLEEPDNVVRINHRLVEWRYKNGLVWNFDEDVVTEDNTLTAQWIRTWTIVFEDGFGNELRRDTVDNGGLVPAPPPVPDIDGYRFIGWFYRSGTQFNPGTHTAGSDNMIQARWIKLYTVTFIVDGEIYEIEEVEAGALLERPQDPEKEGFRFFGWREVNGYIWNFDEHRVNGDNTLTAEWIQLFTVHS